MGLLFCAVTIPSALITTAFFLNIFTSARFIFIGALTRLGLYKPPPEQQLEEPTSDNYVLILDPSSPSLVPVPVRAVTAAIKNRVPIVLFRDYYNLLCPQQENNNIVCSICLDCIECVHYIRDLCNCRHLFHSECLDTWVDEGHLTCPLCRSMLLPPKTNPFLFV